MGIFKKIVDKLYLKQWGIGIIRADIKDIIREKRTDLPIHWIPLPDKNLSYADPFILSDDGRIKILYEQMTSYKMDGHIGLLELDADLKVITRKTILQTGSHLSYPFIFREDGKTYMFPENALGKGLICYEYDELNDTVAAASTVLDKATLDSTIIKRDGKYWLFCTLLGEALNSELHIFYADQLKGPYSPHAGNPVVTGLRGSRPAGNFIEVDGELYRPAQNCTHYYGESLVIHRLKTLSSSKFEEEFYMEIKPKSGDEFGYGLHTLNSGKNYVVVDGQKSHFEPIGQFARKIGNLLAKT